MIVKVIHRNIYPRVGYPVKPYFQVLVATFCILKQMQVNWASLAIHAMSRSWLVLPQIDHPDLGEEGYSDKGVENVPADFHGSQGVSLWLRQLLSTHR